MSERWDRKLNAFNGYHDPVSLTIMAVGSVASAVIGADSADKASRRAQEGADAATVQKQKFFDIAQEQLAPYREIGNDAVDKLNAVFINGEMDQFYESAGYKFNVSEGEKALERKQSAAGSRYGGRALKEAAQFSQGIASQEFGNFFNRLNSIAGMGANAAAGGANNAMNTGSGMADIISNNATNQANIEMQKGQNLNNSIQSGLGNLTTLQTYNDMKSMLNPTTTKSVPNSLINAQDAYMPGYIKR